MVTNCAPGSISRILLILPSLLSPFLSFLSPLSLFLFPLHLSISLFSIFFCSLRFWPRIPENRMHSLRGMTVEKPSKLWSHFQTDKIYWYPRKPSNTFIVWEWKVREEIDENRKEGRKDEKKRWSVSCERKDRDDISFHSSESVSVSISHSGFKCTHKSIIT